MPVSGAAHCRRSLPAPLAERAVHIEEEAMIRVLVTGLKWLVIAFFAVLALSIIVGLVAGTDGCLRVGPDIRIGICLSASGPAGR